MHPIGRFPELCRLCGGADTVEPQVPRSERLPKDPAFAVGGVSSVSPPAAGGSGLLGVSLEWEFLEASTGA